MCDCCAGVYKKVWLKELVWKGASSPVDTGNTAEVAAVGIGGSYRPQRPLSPVPAHTFPPSSLTVFPSQSFFTNPFSPAPYVSFSPSPFFVLSLPGRPYPDLTSSPQTHICWLWLYLWGRMFYPFITLCVSVISLVLQYLGNKISVPSQVCHHCRGQWREYWASSATGNGLTTEAQQHVSGCCIWKTEMVLPLKVSAKKNDCNCQWNMNSSPPYTDLSSNSASLFLAKYTPCCFSPAWF